MSCTQNTNTYRLNQIIQQERAMIDDNSEMADGARDSTHT